MRRLPLPKKRFLAAIRPFGKLRLTADEMNKAAIKELGIIFPSYTVRETSFERIPFWAGPTRIWIWVHSESESIQVRIEGRGC